MSEKKIIILMISLFCLLIVLGITYNIIDSNIIKDVENNTTSESEEYLIKDKIDSITIKYYPNYNIGSAEAINSVNNETFIDPIYIKLDGENKKKYYDFLSRLKETKYDFKSSDVLYVLDYYQIIVNDNIIISMGYEFGYVNDTTFDVPRDIKELTDSIIEEYNEKYLYKSFEYKTGSYKLKEDKKYIDFNEEQLNHLSKFKYYYVHDNEDYNTYDGGYKYTLKLDDLLIYLYSGNIAYMKNVNEESYIIIESKDKEELHNYLNSLNKSKKN